MLISWTMRNWRTFRDTTLSMLPTAERRFSWHLQRYANNPKRLLPVAVIYGANAAGKSNFAQGISFLAHFVTTKDQDCAEIPVDPSFLDPQSMQEPTSFSVLFRAQSQVYRYELAATRAKIVSEKLSRLGRTRETILFARDDQNTFCLDRTVDAPRHRFVCEGTRPTRPFLAAAHDQQVAFVEPAWQWFASTLRPDGTKDQSQLAGLFENGSPFQQKKADLLAQYDTHITGLSSRYGGEMSLRQGLLPWGQSSAIVVGSDGSRLRLARRDGSVTVSVLHAVHTDVAGNSVSCDFRDESAGTRQLLDLLPILIACAEQPAAEQVLVLDEMDSSLHPNLLHRFVADFLLSCGAQTRVQLLVTTHNAKLMNQELLRRDEIWLVERKAEASDLHRVSDCKGLPRKADLEKCYLGGCMGGVPHVKTPLPAVLPKERQYEALPG